MEQFMAQVMRQLEDIHRAHLVSERRNEERYQLLQDKLATVQKTLNQLLATRKLNKSSSLPTQQEQQQPQQHVPMSINVADIRPSISSPTPMSDTASLPLPLHHHEPTATTPATNGHTNNSTNGNNNNVVRPVTRVGTPRPHDAPQFGMLPGLRTVEEVWREWTVGGGSVGVDGDNDTHGVNTPSVEERERRWPAGKWRRDAKVKSAFHQRKIIVEAIKSRCDRTRCSVSAAIAYYESLREAAKNTSLDALSDALRRQRQQEEGGPRQKARWLSPTGTSHDHPHHHHHFGEHGHDHDHQHHQHHGHGHNHEPAGTQPHIVESIAIAQI